MPILKKLLLLLIMLAVGVVSTLVVFHHGFQQTPVSPLDLARLRYMLIQYAEANGEFPENLSEIDYSALSISRRQMMSLIYHASQEKYGGAEKLLLLFEESQYYDRRPAWLGGDSGAKGTYAVWTEGPPVWIPVEPEPDAYFVELLGSNVVLTRLLLERGHDPNIADEYGRTPLYAAIKRGNFELLELLLKHHANPNVSRVDEFTPLFACAIAIVYEEFRSGDREDYMKMADILITYGANKDIYAAIARDEINVIEKMVTDEPASVNLIRRPYSPLKVAAATGREDVVRLLLDNGADVNPSPQWAQGQPLYEAAKREDTAIIEILISAGAQIDDFALAALHRNEEVMASITLLGELPGSNNVFVAAAILNNYELVELLLDLPFVRQDQDLKDMALWSAAQYGSVESARHLIAAGANVNAGRVPPLNRAVWYEQTEFVALLLENGANPNNATDLANVSSPFIGGRTALHVAAGRTAKGMIPKDNTIISMLLESGADPDIFDQSGDLPLFGALAFGNLQAVPVLLKYGANPTLCLPGCMNATDIALFYGRYREYRLLQEAAETKQRMK